MGMAYFRSFKTQSQRSEKKRQRIAPRKESLIFVPSPKKADEQQREVQTAPVLQKKSVHGYIFHSGPQTLTVTVPGDVAPVRLASHTVLNGLQHDEHSPDIMVLEEGTYEISYSVVMKAANEVYAALSLQADGKTIDGSVTARLIDTQETAYSAAVLAEIKAGALIRLVITSGTAAGVQLSDSGVSASIMIKKIN